MAAVSSAKATGGGDRLRTSTMAVRVSVHGNARQCLVVHTLLAHAQSTALPLSHLHRDYARPCQAFAQDWTPIKAPPFLHSFFFGGGLRLDDEDEDEDERELLEELRPRRRLSAPAFRAGGDLRRSRDVRRVPRGGERERRRSLAPPLRRGGELKSTAKSVLRACASVFAVRWVCLRMSMCV